MYSLGFTLLFWDLALLPQCPLPVSHLTASISSAYKSVLISLILKTQPYLPLKPWSSLSSCRGCQSPSKSLSWLPAASRHPLPSYPAQSGSAFSASQPSPSEGARDPRLPHPADSQASSHWASEASGLLLTSPCLKPPRCPDPALSQCSSPLVLSP